MNNLKSALCTFLILTLSLNSHALLEDKFQNEKDLFKKFKISSWTPEEKELLNSYSYLFIDGILGDLTQDLYKNLIPYLESELPSTSVRVLRPSSFNNMEANAKWISLELKSKKEKPLIVVAHSRGAAELYLALLKDPSLFEQASIHKIIFVQGAFSGSPLAEWVTTLLQKTCPTKSPSQTSEVCSFAKLFEQSAQSLNPYTAIEIRSRYQKNLKDTAKLHFQNNVYFVRSQSSSKTTTMPLKASHAYLKRYYNGFYNDGILLTSHQRIKGMGQDLGILEADHLSLLGSNKDSPEESILFFRALMAQLLFARHR